MINDITGWIVFDECPDTPLDAIFPLSRRAACLVARNKPNSTNLNTNFLNIQGAVEMMLGLDYHHENFMNAVKRLAEAKPTDEARGLKAQLVHEVVAYLNRMGQFHYFIVSPFVRKFCPDAKTLAPTIEKFLPFRMKHSAHRSLDAPKEEDSQHLQETQAMSMSAIGPKIFEPKPGQSHNILDARSDAEKIAFFRDNWKKCFWICQLLTDDPKDMLNFSLEREHHKIMKEAFLILERVLHARARSSVDACHLTENG